MDSDQVQYSPVSAKSRIDALDGLRGVALLGILLMNIVAFAFPFAAYSDPSFSGDSSGPGLTFYMATDTLVEGSMRAVFSMLFGAGMLVFLNKPGTETGVIKKLYYRRSFLLVGFGLFNAYCLLWSGDILYSYGLTALLLYFFRDAPAERLLKYVAVIFGFMLLLHSAFHFQGRALESGLAEVESLPADAELTEAQLEILDGWENYLEQQGMSQQAVDAEIAAKKSRFADTFLFVAEANFFLQVVAFPIFAVWDVLGMMLLGMALFRLGILDGSRSLGFYLGMVAVGLGVGIPLNYWESLMQVNSDFAIHWVPSARPTYDLGRFLLAAGYIGLVLAIYKSDAAVTAKRCLQAVGRMALSNYLMQSLICNVLFLGVGFNLFNELSRPRIYLVVLAIWVFQIVFSLVWLSRFRFGPFEWLWRSLTYGKAQPMSLT